MFILATVLFWEALVLRKGEKLDHIGSPSDRANFGFTRGNVWLMLNFPYFPLPC